MFQPRVRRRVASRRGVIRLYCVPRRLRPPRRRFLILRTANKFRSLPGKSPLQYCTMKGNSDVRDKLHGKRPCAREAGATWCVQPCACASPRFHIHLDPHCQPRVSPRPHPTRTPIEGDLELMEINFCNTPSQRCAALTCLFSRKILLRIDLRPPGRVQPKDQVTPRLQFCLDSSVACHQPPTPPNKNSPLDVTGITFY